MEGDDITEKYEKSNEWSNPVKGEKRVGCMKGEKKTRKGKSNNRCKSFEKKTRCMKMKIRVQVMQLVRKREQRKARKPEII